MGSSGSVRGALSNERPYRDQFSGGPESMGDHDSGFDDWWSVGRRYATLWASLLRQAKQRIRPLFTQERIAISAGQFLDGRWGNEPRIPHKEKHQCRSMCTANSMKKSSIASRGGGADQDHESSRHISLCVASMIKVFMSASTPRCRLPQALAGYASPE